MDAASPASTGAALPHDTAGPSESAADAQRERRRRPQMPYSERPLVKIHGDLDAVREQMLEISTIMKERASTQKAASHLRFLTLHSTGTGSSRSAKSRKSETSTLGETSRESCSCQSVETFDAGGDSAVDVSGSNDGIESVLSRESTTDAGLTLVKRGLFPDCRHYIAVSYCWEKSTDTACSSDGLHTGGALLILDQSTDSEPFLRLANAPPHILKRAVRYAVSKSCSLVWIDQECIHQHDREDKENAIQSMDAVYANSLYPVAILSTRIESQEYLDALARLASSQMRQFAQMLMGGELASAPWDTSSRPFLREITWTTEQQLFMLEVLIEIVSDRWFTRSWTMQELICSNDMVLLLEFDRKLKCPENMESWSDGEARISIKQLLDAIWWSIMPHNLALLAELPEQRSNILSVFWKAYPFSRPIPGKGSRNICTFLSAWNLIQSTQNSRIADRLAIMGNLCDYPMRINSNEAETRALNYSTCMITQALLNGDLEVLLHRPMLVDFRGAVASRESRIFPGKGSWLRSLVHYPVERPGGFGAGYDSRWPPAYFAVCGLSNLGLSCRGRLWKISKEIRLRSLQRSIYRRHHVYELSIFFADLPHHVVRSAMLFIRWLSASVGMRKPFENSPWLIHPRLLGGDARQKRVDRTRTLHFLRHFTADFRYAQFLRMSGRAASHPLGDISIPVPEKLENPLLDGVDLQRLGWLSERVERHGRLWGASYVGSDGSLSSQESAIFDCGEVEDEVTEVEDDHEFNGVESDTSKADSSRESRQRPPVYIFTPHTDGLVRHPNHSVQFRALSWIVDIVDGKQLRCKDLVYGLYDYGQTEPTEYILSWD